MASDLANFRAAQSQNLAVASLQTRVDDAYSADGRRVVYDARETRGLATVNAWLTALYLALALAAVARAATRRPRGSARALAALVLAAVLYPLLVGPAERALLWLSARAADRARYALFA